MIKLRYNLLFQMALGLTAINLERGIEVRKKRHKPSLRNISRNQHWLWSIGEAFYKLGCPICISRNLCSHEKTFQDGKLQAPEPGSLTNMSEGRNWRLWKTRPRSHSQWVAELCQNLKWVKQQNTWRTVCWFAFPMVLELQSQVWAPLAGMGKLIFSLQEPHKEGQYPNNKEA